MIETVEAIQCLLEGTGVILVPVDLINAAPEVIYDEDIENGNYHIFHEYDLNSKIWRYRHHIQSLSWRRIDESESSSQRSYR